ncbi:PRKDC-like protein [Mya arenaria]|uniref:non-specific serine/threonine protein kinase n=1 Tax=Mya arenaria TaxID=6604 RepID=A0ABY7DE34_MYAAR|nr:PRKDC-like protein [Mya arenaria]
MTTHTWGVIPWLLWKMTTHTWGVIPWLLWKMTTHTWGGDSLASVEDDDPYMGGDSLASVEDDDPYMGGDSLASEEDDDPYMGGDSLASVEDDDPYMGVIPWLLWKMTTHTWGLVYMDHISSHLQKLDDSQASVESDDPYLDTKLRLKLLMARSCGDQNNFAQTLRILKETYKECKGSADGSVLCQWGVVYASTHYKKIRALLEPWKEETLTSLFTAFDQLDKMSENEALLANPRLGRQHRVLTGEGRGLMALGIQDFDLKGLRGTRAEQKLMQHSGLEKMTKVEVTEKLISHGYSMMKSSLAVEGGVADTQIDGMSADQAYLATAKYCDNFLRQKEEGDLDIGDRCVSAFPESVVVCLLQALKLGSLEARQRFPRLLQIIELHPESTSTFVSKSAEVPSWMFMLWISQMLAILDKPEAIAAVVYPLKLSQEGFKFGTSKKDIVHKDAVDRLAGLLGPDQLPLADRLILALECFGQPDQEIKDSFDEMAKLLKKGKKTQAKVVYNKLFNRIINYKVREKNEAAQGSMKREVGSSGEGTGLDETTADESLITSLPGLDIGSYARKFADKFKKDFDTKFGPEGNKITSMSLKEFAVHKQFIMNLFEEVKLKTSPLYPPGKLSEYSHWMANFNPNIHGRDLEIPGQYTGLSKPLPEYHVKIAGFDQAVKVMTSLRKPKRVTIHGNDERDYHFLVKGGEDLRQDQRIEQLFYIMNQVFLQDPACRSRKLQLKTYQVIPMTSRRSFQKLSTSPEAFHVLRSHCMQTHAMLCMCQYVMGIGDRHLSNFMVNLNTGEMIGIDFGHAFGSATQFLPIPELVPFRLTRQLRNLMLPLQEQGLVESTMIHQNAERQLQSLDSSEETMHWYPREKIQYVKRKLKGANPAYITRDELKLGHGKKAVFKDYETVALGHKENARCQLPEAGLTVEQQVTALIDQATDPNIHGRTWVGWEPWM